MSTRVLLFALISICFFECKSPHQDLEPCENIPNVILRFYKSQVSAMDSLQYVYGVQDSIKPIGLNDPLINSYHYGDFDTFFQLPLDVNRDSCAFVLLHKNGSLDTIGFEYRTEKMVSSRCGLGFSLKDLKIYRNPMKLCDSVTIKSKSFKYYYFNKIQVDLFLQ